AGDRVKANRKGGGKRHTTDGNIKKTITETISGKIIAP
ncbi:hypothetical protein PvtlMGM1_1418, partial [Prevotella sp. MGM1]